MSEDITKLLPIEDLVAKSSYVTEEPLVKAFMPWHSPRKQFVREKQFAHQSRQLIIDSPRHDGIVRYLGLPGDTLLDLRMLLRKVCVPQRHSLAYLGFNGSASETSSNRSSVLAISEDFISKNPFVETASVISGDDFRRISARDSMAYKYLISHGPFDVVNLDLCDGFANHANVGIGDTYFEAVAALFTEQIKHRSSWLLFIATRVDAQCVDAIAREKFRELFKRNLDFCEKFRDATNPYCNLEAVGDDGEHDFILVSGAIVKWIAGLMKHLGYQWKMELKSALAYRVRRSRDCEDMLSLAIHFKPLAASTPDPSGILKHSFCQDQWECAVAARSITRVINRGDVDKILGKEDLLSSMIELASDLLDDAGYDIQEYESWARGRLAI